MKVFERRKKTSIKKGREKVEFISYTYWRKEKQPPQNTTRQIKEKFNDYSDDGVSQWMVTTNHVLWGSNLYV